MTASRHDPVTVVAGLLFTAAIGLTITSCRSMSAMGGMPMPGGWTMSMTWMRMPGQSWPGAAASFLGMWVVMMTAMMLPSLVPLLRRYRDARAGDGTRHPGGLTALAGVGYFAAWAVFGLVAYALGMTIADVAMQQPALARLVPLATGIVVATAGGLQFTNAKARRLASCRGVHHHVARLAGGAGSDASVMGAAWRHGLQLGRECIACCGGLMAIQLVMGIMDLGVMTIVGVAITAERVAPAGVQVARASGVVAVAGGFVLVARAVISG